MNLPFTRANKADVFEDLHRPECNDGLQYARLTQYCCCDSGGVIGTELCMCLYPIVTRHIS